MKRVTKRRNPMPRNEQRYRTQSQSQSNHHEGTLASIHRWYGYLFAGILFFFLLLGGLELLLHKLDGIFLVWARLDHNSVQAAGVPAPPQDRSCPCCESATRSGGPLESSSPKERGWKSCRRYSKDELPEASSGPLLGGAKELKLRGCQPESEGMDLSFGEPGPGLASPGWPAAPSRLVLREKPAAFLATAGRCWQECEQPSKPH